MNTKINQFIHHSLVKLDNLSLKKKILSCISVVAILFLIFFLFSRSLAYSGYIDADMTYLSSSFPGRLSELQVRRGEFVKKGQTLFRVDQAYENFDLKIDDANLVSLRANYQQIMDQLKYAEGFYQRQKLMSKSEAASVDEVESARKNVEVLKSQLRAMDANIEGSNARLNKTIWQGLQKDGIASEAGLIFDTFKTIGEYSATGQPIVALITAANVKVIFFIPEPQLSKIAIGQKIRIEIDGNKNAQEGVIEYISSKAEYTPPVIFSRDERQKLVYKIIARPVNPNLTTLHLGQPVTVGAIQK